MINKKPASDPLRSVDWSSLSNNPQLSHQYSIEVRNWYNALLTENSCASDYNMLMESVSATALEVLPKNKKMKRANPYNDPEIAHHHNILKESALLHCRDSLVTSKEQLEEAKKLLDEAYSAATELTMYISKLHAWSKQTLSTDTAAHGTLSEN